MAVADVVAEAVEAHREKAEEHRISVKISDCVTGARVLADKDAFSMIFSNLVENAVKYTREGQRHRDPLEDRAKVSDEFYRARNEQTGSIPGTGLGLSLVKRLTELHEGTVGVSSEPGKGSEFIVRLPSIA